MAGFVLGAVRLKIHLRKLNDSYDEEDMIDKCKVFEEAVKNALMTDKIRHFRLCIDEKIIYL